MGRRSPCLKLPAGPDGAKVGLDDYLGVNSREAFGDTAAASPEASGPRAGGCLVASMGEA